MDGELSSSSSSEFAPSPPTLRPHDGSPFGISKGTRSDYLAVIRGKKTAYGFHYGVLMRVAVDGKIVRTINF